MGASARKFGILTSVHAKAACKGDSSNVPTGASAGVASAHNLKHNLRVIKARSASVGVSRLGYAGVTIRDGSLESTRREGPAHGDVHGDAHEDVPGCDVLIGRPAEGRVRDRNVEAVEGEESDYKAKLVLEAVDDAVDRRAVAKHGDGGAVGTDNAFTGGPRVCKNEVEVIEGPSERPHSGNAESDNRRKSGGSNNGVFAKLERLSVKASLGNCHRRFGMRPNNICFNSLVNEMKRLFHVFGYLGVCYLDNEGDYIVLSSDVELEELLVSVRRSDSPLIRLQLCVDRRK